MASQGAGKRRWGNSSVNWGKPCSVGETSSPAHWGQYLKITQEANTPVTGDSKVRDTGESRGASDTRHMYTRAHTERMLIFTQNQKTAGHSHTCEPANTESVLTPQATVPGRGPGVAGYSAVSGVCPSVDTPVGGWGAWGGGLTGTEAPGVHSAEGRRWGGRGPQAWALGELALGHRAQQDPGHGAGQAGVGSGPWGPLERQRRHSAHRTSP